MKNRHTFILLINLIYFTGSYSQPQGDFRGSMGIVYGTDVENVGVNAGLEYLFTERLSAAPSFSYFFIDSGNFSSINLDGRYYFLNQEGVQLYGLLGLAIESAKIEGQALGQSFSVSDSEAGLNIGGGAIFPFSESLGVILQVKIATPGDTQVTPLAGLVITF